MESSKENIEAQLCAYIDGELDEAARIEIERHLASNSQHKSLIAELRRHSGLLQDLPRAKAPLELNEALCGQLERSALLNPSNEEASETSLSINRWPQMMAVAAVLLLAIGLGIVVYYVLPPSGGNSHGTVALDEKNIDKKIDRSKSSVDIEITSKNKTVELSRNTPDPSDARGLALSSKPGGVQTQPESPLDLKVSRARDLNDGRFITAKEVDEFRKHANLWLRDGNDAFNLSNSSLFLVVSTNNAAAANGQVAEYFKSNRIQYMNYDDSVATEEINGVARDGDRRRSAGGFASGLDTTPSSRAKELYEDKKDAAPATSSPVAGGGGGGGRAGGVRDAAAQATERADVKELEKIRQSDALAKSERAAGGQGTRGPLMKRNDSLPAAPDGSAAARAPAKPGPGTLADAAQVPLKSESEGAPSDKNLPAATVRKAELAQQNAGSLGKGAAGGALDYGRESDRDQTAPKPELRDSIDRGWAMREALRPAGEKHPADNPLPAGHVIIARMNRRQANELSAVLSREQGQRAELTTFAPVEVTASTRAIAPAESGKKLGLNEPTHQFGLAAAAPVAPAPTKEPLAAADPAARPPTLTPTQREEKQVTGRAALDRSHDAPTTRYGEFSAKDAYKLDEKDKAADFNRDVPNFLHLQNEVMDEPVDVVIFVKDDAFPAAPSLQLGTPASTGTVGNPKGEVESKPPADSKK